MSTIPPPGPDGSGPEDPDRDRDDRGGRGDEDIDAEFARMMEGLDLDAPAPSDAPAGTTPRPDAPRVPDSAEELLAEQDGEAPIAVVATSVASPKALAGAVRLGQEARSDGLEVPEGTRIVSTGTGAIALGPLAESAAHDLAAVVSTALQRHGVVLFWRRGDRMTATRYRQGERGDDVSPALVLGAVDGSVEQLLLGSMTADELAAAEDGGIDPRSLSRAQALRWIATGRRKP